MMIDVQSCSMNTPRPPICMYNWNLLVPL
jgi:hypothetical protein